MTREAADVSPPLPTELGSPWQILRTFLPFKTKNHKLWWDKTAPVLGNALEIAKYSVEAQYHHLLLHFATVTAAVGPFPRGDNRTWLGFGGEVGTVELSFNYQNNSKCTVRLGFEPIGPHAGTDIDPTNEYAASSLLQHTKSMNPRLNMDCFNWFNQKAVLSNGEASQARSDHRYQTQRWMTFDLKHSGGFIGKVYFFNDHKADFLGINSRSHLFTTIRENKCLSHFHTPLLQLEDFFSRPGRQSLLPMMSVAIDCVDPKETRLKVYGHGFLKSLSTIYDCWTLDGKLMGEHIEKGFEIFEKLWRQLIDDDPSDLETKHMVEVNWEFSPGRSEPIPKIYLFLMHVSDARAVEVLNGIFEDLGWHGHIRTQAEFMSKAWSAKNLKTSKDFIKIVSFAYIPEQGPYITTYGNPTLSDTERQL